MIDPHSVTWREVVRRIERRIDELDRENRKDLEEKETVSVRAEIKALLRVLDWGKTPPDVRVSETNFGL